MIKIRWGLVLLIIQVLITGIIVLFPTFLPSYVRHFYSLTVICTVPGVILVSSLLKNSFDFFERLSLAVISSILYAICFGLIFSLSVPKFANLSLSSDSLTNSYLIINIMISFITVMKTVLFNVDEFVNGLKISQVFRVFAPLSILFLAISGALVLNSGGQNSITLLMLFSIALLIPILFILKDRENTNLYPFIIYFLSLSLLLMYSLRSNYLIGWDIHQEFRVFQITQSIGKWSTENYASAYNATLSISLLPVLISTITKIPDLYVYKIVFPILFSFTPIFIYLFSKKYLNNFNSFMSSVFFIFQFQFMQQMPALNRQALAFLFFSALLFVIFHGKIGKINRFILFCLTAIGLILSHYSTAYIANILLIGAFSISSFLVIIKKLLKLVFKAKIEINLQHIKLWMIIYLLSLTYIWYGVISNSVGDVVSLVDKISANISKVNNDELKSPQAQSAFGKNLGAPTQDQVLFYSNEVRNDYIKNFGWYKLYPKELTDNYPPQIMYSKEIVAVDSIIRKTILFSLGKVQTGIRLLLFFGSLILFLNFFLNRSKYDIDYSSITAIGMMLLGTIIFLPYLSLAYNFERLYQQLLIIFGSVILIGLLSLPFIKRNLLTFGLITFSCLFFLSSSGVINQFFGGTAHLNLNNYGEDYDRFFTKDSELSGVKWLERFGQQEIPISMDQYSWLKFLSHSYRTERVLFDVTPSSLPENGYVYASRTNFVDGRARRTYITKPLIFSFPLMFLNENTNLVYSTKNSAVYN